MKKFLLLLILAVAGLQPVSAQSYRGFADIEAGYSFYSEWALIGATTTHGVQLAEKFFIGAGTGILTDFTAVVMPLYADFRFDFFNGKKVSPFVDLKVGYTLGNSGRVYEDYDDEICNGIYLNPTVGFRIRLTNRMGINIGLAYSLNNYYCYNYYEKIKMNKELGHAIAIKVGIDF